MYFAEGWIHFNEQVFFRVYDQRLQDVLKNVVSAPFSEYVIKQVVPSTWQQVTAAMLFPVALLYNIKPPFPFATSRLPPDKACLESSCGWLQVVSVQFPRSDSMSYGKPSGRVWQWRTGIAIMIAKSARLLLRNICQSCKVIRITPKNFLHYMASTMRSGKYFLPPPRRQFKSES